MARDIGQASIIIAMATAVLIIVRAVKKITDEKPWDLVKGITAVSAIILGISGAVRLAGEGFCWWCPLLFYPWLWLYGLLVR